MVNFTKLATLAFVGAVAASPIDRLDAMLEKRQLKSWDNDGSTRWPSVQTCYDALCRGGEKQYVSRCHSITQCGKGTGGCAEWYCARIETTKYVNQTLPVVP